MVPDTAVICGGKCSDLHWLYGWQLLSLPFLVYYISCVVWPTIGNKFNLVASRAFAYCPRARVCAQKSSRATEISLGGAGADCVARCDRAHIQIVTANSRGVHEFVSWRKFVVLFNKRWYCQQRILFCRRKIKRNGHTQKRDETRQPGPEHVLVALQPYLL